MSHPWTHYTAMTVATFRTRRTSALTSSSSNAAWKRAGRLDATGTNPAPVNQSQSAWAHARVVGGSRFVSDFLIYALC